MDSIKEDAWLLQKKGDGVCDGAEGSLLWKIYREVQMANQVVLVLNYVAELATHMQTCELQLGTIANFIHRTIYDG